MYCIKKKTLILMLSYLFAAVLVLGGYILITNSTRMNYLNTAKNGYRSAFAEVSSAMSELDNTLMKCKFAKGTDISESLCAQIYGKCQAITMTMSALPFDTQQLERTDSFVGRVGDYAYTLARTVSENNGFTEEERDNLKKMSETVSQLSSQILQLSSDIENGTVIFDDPENEIKNRTEQSQEIDSLSTVMLNYECSFPEQEELRYDGKYTFRDLDKQSTDIVSKEQAKKAAAEFLNIETDRLTLRYTSQEDLAYYFSVSVPGGNADIVVAGDGKIKSFLSSRLVYSQNDTIGNPEKIAADFLNGKGYINMKLVRSQTVGGITKCEFAPLQNGFICYPDTVYISIASDNGGLYAFDASGYIKSSRQRDIPNELITKEKAKLALPDDIIIKESRLSVINSAGGKEVFAYEFVCCDEQENGCTVFVDAITGNQKEIQTD